MGFDAGQMLLSENACTSMSNATTMMNMMMLIEYTENSYIPKH